MKKKVKEDFADECDGTLTDTCYMCYWYDVLRGCVLVKRANVKKEKK